MDIQDIIFSDTVPTARKQDIIELMDREHITDPYTKILIPTATNDDVNGSQHAHNGGTDFTYRDATMEDVLEASAVGVYDYFSNVDAQTYTGHYYNGDGAHFQAIVVDPPAYAATYHI
jgi:hypothetical protein